MNTAPSSDLAEGRRAFDERRWADAEAALAAADSGSPLEPEDLERLADATFWLGHMARTIEVRQRLYAACKAAGDRRGAARTALHLVADHSHRLESPIASGWLSRATRLLEGMDESAEHASLGRARLNTALGKGDLDEALSIAEANLALGVRLGDQDVETVALQDRARVLLALGRVDEGLADLNEAVVSAVSGEISAYPSAIVYCNATIACEDLTDYRRAGEFAEAASRWCESEEITGFPGMCRVRRVEIIRLKGDLVAAEAEARKACAELADFSPAYAAEGYYQIGEIRLRLGDHAGAEEAFAEAHRRGREPMPGLAMLRLAQGDVAGSASALSRALSDPALTALERARLLPAEAAAALALEDGRRAHAAAAELSDIAATFRTDMLRAQAHQARAGAALLEGAIDVGIAEMRDAVRAWKETDAPWEVAQARLLLAEAYQAAGESSAAGLESRAAMLAFDTLGAKLDAARALGFTEGRLPQRFQPTSTRRVTRTFMFTDIVRSTPLVEAVGDDAWTSLLRWHDAMIRRAVLEHRGHESDHQGDGFLVVFESADDAIDCALDIQHTLARHRQESGFAPQVRIGLHTADALETREGHAGSGVHAAARIGNMAHGSQVLVSRAVFEAADRKRDHGPWEATTLRGIRDAVELTVLE